MDLYKENNTHTIFLAMFRGGGGPYTVPQIIYMYDFINKCIPTRLEIENSLNILLHLGLIKNSDDAYYIPKEQFAQFEAYRNKAHKDRLDAVIAYFNKLSLICTIPGTIKLTERQYEGHVKEFRKSFKNILFHE